MLGYKELLKEKCSYQRYTGKNKYNEKSYGEVQEINCFVSFDFTNILGYEEQEVKLNKVVFIDNTFEPDPFDKIDGLEIRQIKPVKGLLTQVIGWEIVL